MRRIENKPNHPSSSFSLGVSVIAAPLLLHVSSSPHENSETVISN